MDSCMTRKNRSVFVQSVWAHRFIIFVVLWLSVGVMLDAQVLDDIEPSKEAMKEARAMTKAGWNVASNALTMEKQIEHRNQLQKIQMETDDDTSILRYVLGTAEATAQNASMARNKAVTLCKGRIAQSMQTAIQSLIKIKMKTVQISTTEAHSEEDILQIVTTLSEASLSQCQTICEFSMTGADGSVTVQLTLAADLKNAVLPNF